MATDLERLRTRDDAPPLFETGPRLRAYVLLVGSVALLGLLLRCLRLGAESFWLDEALSIRVISRPWLEMPGFLATESAHPPLYFLALRAWTSIFGLSEVAVRFPSVLFGTLSIPLMAAFGSRIGGRGAGLFAAALLCVSPFHVQYSQDARPYALLGLLVLWSLWTYHRLIEAPSRRRVAEYLISGVLLLHTHTYAVFAVLAQNVHYLLVWRSAGGRGLSFKGWIGTQLALGALFLPWFLALVGQFQNPKMWNWQPETGLHTFRETLLAFTWDSRLLAGTLALLALLGVAIPWIRLGRRRWIDVCGSALVWTLVPLLVPLLVSEIVGPMFVPRYAVQTFLGLLLLAALGLAWIPVPTLLRSLLVLLVLCLPVNRLRHLYLDPQKPPWREIVSFVEERAEDADSVVLAPWFVQPVYDHYARRALERLQLRPDDESSGGLVILDDLAPGERPPRTGPRVFLVSRFHWLRLPESDRSVESLGRRLLPEYRLEEAASFHAVEVGVFRRRDGR